MSTFDELFGAKSLGGETGGATLDLLKQIQAAAQSGISVGMEKKEQHLGNFLKASQDVFTTRYSKEEPMIEENGKKRPLNDKELLGSALGIPPKSLVWEKRPETTATPMSWREYKLSEEHPEFKEYLKGYRSAGLAKEKFDFAVRKYGDKKVSDAYNDAADEFREPSTFGITLAQQKEKDPELENKIIIRALEILEKQEKLKKGKAPKEVVPY